jgi:hypothetical protein
MLIILLLLWLYVFMLKYLLQSTSYLKSITIYPFYLNYESNYYIRRIEELTQMPTICRILPTVFNIGAIFMVGVIVSSPFLFIYLLSHVHISSSYLVVNDEHKDSVSSLIVPLVPYLNIPQSYFISFWTTTILSALFHELGYASLNYTHSLSKLSIISLI